MNDEEKAAVRAALKAWQADVCAGIHGDRRCTRMHYSPADDDPDYQRIAALLKG